MRLEDTPLAGLGSFTDTPGGFRVDAFHLDERWPYIFANPRMLLRVDERGPDYAQIDPPSGAVLFRRERFQDYPSLLVWISVDGGEPFCCFGRPGPEPEQFCCEYSPEEALYTVVRDGVRVETGLFVPEGESAIVMTVRLAVAGDRPRQVRIVPVMRPHFAAAALDPWDVPSLYQSIRQVSREPLTFEMELRSPAGIPEERQKAWALCDLASPDAVELDYAAFIGRGSFERADFVLGGAGGHRDSVNGRQGVIALSKRLTLQAGAPLRFTFAVGQAPAEELARYLNPEERQQKQRLTREKWAGFLNMRAISTRNPAFDRYVNEYLPLQLGWVRLLDRGWPTGMRGTRDCAQDTTALIPLEAAAVRKTLLEILGIQRSDGWFPRQYSTTGRAGKHDLREYVDGGVWVWELLHDYLCWTKDYDLLSECAPWLDSDEEDLVIEHALAICDYYLNPENLGEHGLCLIRGGDWNDSINRAGLEGRGESVMVSCQALLMLRQASHLFGFLQRERPGLDVPDDLPEELSRLGEELKAAILRFALNGEGYLNGVYTDDAEWVFSPEDPDGAARVNVPVNAFGIISGALQGEHLQTALGRLKALKQQDGWPLFFPPIGDPPIRKLGRIGQGDLSPGLGENGAMYNHGCHGFFARAAAAAGDGGLACEILRYMLPYDQRCHPVERAKTAPYGVVNHWKTAPGEEGRGGAVFLSGSISTALRGAYGGLFGITGCPEGLAIDPALPPEWPSAKVRFRYLGAEVEVTFEQTSEGPATVLVNGQEAAVWLPDPVLGRVRAVIPDACFAGGGTVSINYVTADASGA